MDQKKSQGQQQSESPRQGQQDRDRSQHGSEEWNQRRNPDREPAEGLPQQMPAREQSGQQWSQTGQGGQGSPTRSQSGQGGQGSPTHYQGQEDSSRTNRQDQEKDGDPQERNQSGITDRGLEREMDEQGDLPDRGVRNPER